MKEIHRNLLVEFIFCQKKIFKVFQCVVLQFLISRSYLCCLYSTLLNSTQIYSALHNAPIWLTKPAFVCGSSPTYFLTLFFLHRFKFELNFRCSSEWPHPKNAKTYLRKRLWDFPPHHNFFFLVRHSPGLIIFWTSF